MRTSRREVGRAPGRTLIGAFLALLTTIALAACSGGVVLEPAEGPVVEAREIAQAGAPPDPVAALTPGNPSEVALEASQLFFESAQVVVLASSTEAPAITRAASLAITLGTPLLLTAPPGENIE